MISEVQGGVASEMQLLTATVKIHLSKVENVFSTMVPLRSIRLKKGRSPAKLGPFSSIFLILVNMVSIFDDM